MMDRRNALKNLLITSGSLVMLPAWAKQWTQAEITHNSSFSQTQQDTLRATADAIIPAGNSIGALSVGVDTFLLKLIETCYDKDVQNNVLHQLDNLEASAQRIIGKSFANGDLAQRQDLLRSLSTIEAGDEKNFFILIKTETIRGFSTSKEVMVNHLHYQVVPGHYYGCVDVKA